MYAAFDAGVVDFPGTLHADVPARLNAMLIEGRLGLSPVSAFAYAQSARQMVLLPGLCIGAKREALSVLLISEVPPALLDGAAIAVTRESATSVQLLRVLLERKYRVRTTFIDDDDPLTAALRGKMPALLIGERAIDARFQVPAEQAYDLGAIWQEWTGEASVFAVWVARRDVFQREREAVELCMRRLREAYAWGQEHREHVIAQAHAMHARPVGFYERYYEKLNFTFDGDAQRGLQRYCKELRAIGAIKEIPACEPEAPGVSA